MGFEDISFVMGDTISKGRFLTRGMNTFEVRKESRPISKQSLARGLRNKGVRAAHIKINLSCLHFTNALFQTHASNIGFSGNHGSVTPL